MLYRIIGRQTNGVEVLGYILRDNVNGEIKRVPKEVAYMMALSKQISNVTAQRFNDKVIMKGTTCKLSELPNYNEVGQRIVKTDQSNRNSTIIRIVGKVIEGRGIVGYKVAFKNYLTLEEGSKILSRSQVMELASKGLIDNVRYQTSNGKEILRGIDCKLAELPIIKVGKILA